MLQNNLFRPALKLGGAAGRDRGGSASTVASVCPDNGRSGIGQEDLELVGASDSRSVRLLIADHAPTRLGIRIALDGVACVCGEAGSAEEAIALAGRRQPDLCIVGLELPGGGVVAIRGISAAAPGAAVIVLADSPDPDDLLGCLRAGAIGYLPSSIAGSALRRAVSGVLAGEAAVPRAVVLDLVRELQGMTIPETNGLTPRESQVLAMLRRGKPTGAIAQQLGISPVTVRRHISAVMRKTGLADRETLARAGVRETLRALHAAVPAR
jgi:DNA-binding NarL/FixJ family response regulator